MRGGALVACHRRLLADTLVVRGVDVRHIMGQDRAPEHHLTPGAVADGDAARYPPQS